MKPPAATPSNQAGLIQFLLSVQADSGAFQSTVHRGGLSADDYNGFVTALVLRELEPLAGLPALRDPFRRALDFMAECEAPSRVGFFAFWPQSQWPLWAPLIPEDSDCTATIASELLHYGRIDLERAREIAMTALVPYRLENPPDPGDKPWIRTGAFLTWQIRSVPNPMDCVVNVNVLAFLAQIGFQHQPGYSDACKMVSDAVSSTAGRWECLEQLSPYYPEPAELVAALKNALRRGAGSLRPCFEELERFPSRHFHNDPSNILFSMADRSTLWSSRAIWAARELTLTFS